MSLDYIASLESDSPRIVAALEANRDAPIPWCGDWTVRTARITSAGSTTSSPA